MDDAGCRYSAIYIYILFIYTYPGVEKEVNCYETSSFLRVVDLALNQSQTLETNTYTLGTICGGLFPKMYRDKSATLFLDGPTKKLEKNTVDPKPTKKSTAFIRVSHHK